MTVVGDDAATAAPAGVDAVTVLHGDYSDSVTLLRISQAAGAAPGMHTAHIAMATPLNVELALGLGFEIPSGTGPNDLLVALRGDDQAAVQAGYAAFEQARRDAAATSRAGGSFSNGPAPHTVRSACAAAPDAAVVLLSVPGGSVLGEAMDAIAAGRHVMIFSDNVPLGHEVLLKDAAAAAGVLVMGPDCGTAVIGGVALGFANVLQPLSNGPRVGIVAASGTGAQHLISLLDDAGVGISAVLGLGGRDLSETVGGRSAITALKMLDDDPGTDHIVLISKPPHPATADKVLQIANSGRTPVTTILLGPGRPTISEGVETVLEALGLPVPTWSTWGWTGASDGPSRAAGPHHKGRNQAGRSQAWPNHAGRNHTRVLRGLFSGGTLADEAMVVLAGRLGDIRSNIPLRPDLGLNLSSLIVSGLDLSGQGHVVLDLGDDAFTVGRPHPMIDPTVKLEMLAAQAADPDVAVLLLDVVLGYAAEADPAARLAPAIAAAIESAGTAGRDLSVVVSLCGTAGDPQNRERQAVDLVDGGAQVFSSNAAAARAACDLIESATEIGAS